MSPHSSPPTRSPCHCQGSQLKMPNCLSGSCRGFLEQKLLRARGGRELAHSLHCLPEARRSSGLLTGRQDGGVAEVKEPPHSHTAGERPSLQHSLACPVPTPAARVQPLLLLPGVKSLWPPPQMGASFPGPALGSPPGPAPGPQAGEAASLLTRVLEPGCARSQAPAACPAPARTRAGGGGVGAAAFCVPCGTFQWLIKLPPT